MRPSPTSVAPDPAAKPDAPVPLGTALKSLLPGLRAFPLHVAGALAMLVAAKLAGVALPLVLKRLVDMLDASRSLPIHSVLLLPLALLLGYGALRFANVLFGELRDVAFGRVSQRAMRQAGLAVFEQLHRLDLDFHLSRRSGALARDIERGVEGIGFLLRFSLFTIVPTVLELLMVTIVLWRLYEMAFALIALAAVTIYVAYSVLLTDWRTRFVREANERDSQANARALDSLLNFETVKYFGAERLESERYDRALASYESAAGKSRATLSMLNAGQALIIATGLTAMVSLAALRVGEGRMTLGDFVAVNAFMTQLFLPLNVLGFVYREIRRALTDMGKLFTLQARLPAVSDPALPKTLPAMPLAVSFEDVVFGYSPERTILRGVRFEIPAGHTVAVVGSSGGGKSTLARLLFRFYDAQGGSIRVGGIDVRQLALSELRGRIGVVPQDVVLFNDSLLENLRYGKPDATLEDVQHAVRQAHLDNFIARLPKGLETPVGERGLKLSGGEKQRVAIARVLLKNPPILIFDEATSSLDTVAERAILAAMREAATARTVLVIAHRLSTVIHADEIVVLDQGRVVERGDHEALLAAKGYYARLWSAQKREQQPSSQARVLVE